MKLIQFDSKPLLIGSKKEPKTSDEALEIYSEYLKNDVFNLGLAAGIIIGVVVTFLGCILYIKHLA